MTHRIFVINPGSTSTKLSLFHDEKQILSEQIHHSLDQLKEFSTIIDQYHFRKETIEQFINKRKLPLTSLSVVVGRGGLLHPVPSGTFRVNNRMVEDLTAARYGEHASNLGALLAKGLADPLQIPAYIVDPVVIDELDNVSRIAGHPEFERLSLFHALNQKAAAREAASRIGKQYDEANIIVAHLGGGISVGLHKNGRVVDVNNALDGDGPFSPERTGTVPAGQLVEICFKGKYSHDQIRRILKGEGGMVSYLGTNSTKEVVERIEAGDSKAELIYMAMAYQIAKQIMSLFPGADSNIDAVVLTGGIVHDERYMVSWIKQMLGRGVCIVVIPGEMEQKALALGALRVLLGEEASQEYR
ncbi:MAG: butyrate kinase [Spirochaetota bacterium]|nr:MAG: butyrate kinase [Spirochaetota bacterium]